MIGNISFRLGVYGKHAQIVEQVKYLLQNTMLRPDGFTDVALLHTVSTYRNRDY